MYLQVLNFFCLVVLENSDGDKISSRFLFLLYVTLMVFSGKICCLISCKCCSKQNFGSATDFKEKLRTHKSDINTGKVICGVANHLLNVCRYSPSNFRYLQVLLIENISAQNDDVLTKFCGKEKNTEKCKNLR